jgi:hypothetical protein
MKTKNKEWTVRTDVPVNRNFLMSIDIMRLKEQIGIATAKLVEALKYVYQNSKPFYRTSTTITLSLKTNSACSGLNFKDFTPVFLCAEESSKTSTIYFQSSKTYFKTSKVYSEGSKICFTTSKVYRKVSTVCFRHATVYIITSITCLQNPAICNTPYIIYRNTSTIYHRTSKVCFKLVQFIDEAQKSIDLQSKLLGERFSNI